MRNYQGLESRFCVSTQIGRNEQKSIIKIKGEKEVYFELPYGLNQLSGY